MNVDRAVSCESLSQEEIYRFLILICWRLQSDSIYRRTGRSCALLSQAQIVYDGEW